MVTQDPLERFISDWIQRHLPQQPGVAIYRATNRSVVEMAAEGCTRLPQKTVKVKFVHHASKKAAA